MSSAYRIICLSHDPALIADTEPFNRPEQAEEAVRAGVEGHESCDLMIGRFSYPLVELGCPDSTDRKGRRVAATPCYHSGTVWADVEWLRLLALALRAPDGSEVRAAAEKGVGRCFTPTRVGRLWQELGFEGGEQP